MDYKKYYFNIDSSPIFIEGYTKGNCWNGWECPCFTKGVVDKYIQTEEMRCAFKSTYDPISDTYTFIDNYGDDGSFLEKGHDIVVNGITKHVYDVGAYAWIWDKYTEEEVKRLDWVERIIMEGTEMERIILKQEDGREYELLSMDKKSEYYLLQRMNDYSPTPFVVAKYLSEKDGYISWGYGHYFSKEEQAREFFAMSIVKNLEQNQLNALFEDIYDEVNYFNKFKMICLKERPYEYKYFSDSDWDKFYNLYLDDDALPGFISAEVLDTLEERMRGED